MKKILGFLVFMYVGSANAALIGVDIVSGGFANTNASFTIGWGFDVTSSVSVTHLGFWDEGGDGLVEAHDVGLWASDGTLLAQTIVSNASTTTIASASGFGDWIFETLSGPIILDAGSYIVAGVSGADPFRTFVDSISVDPLLTNFGSGKFERGGTLAFPTSVEDSEFSLFGANILIDDTISVPAPTSILLLGLGIAGLCFKRKKQVA